MPLALGLNATKVSKSKSKIDKKLVSSLFY